MKKLIKHARSMLIIMPARWQNLSQADPAYLLRRRSAPAEWSVVVGLKHLIDTERVNQYRVKCFMKGMAFSAFDPDQEGTLPGERSPVELAREFEMLWRYT